MKLLITLFLCVIGFVSHAQTSKELIGKWKLVKETKDGRNVNYKSQLLDNWLL